MDSKQKDSYTACADFLTYTNSTTSRFNSNNDTNINSPKKTPYSFGHWNERIHTPNLDKKMSMPTSVRASFKQERDTIDKLIQRRATVAQLNFSKGNKKDAVQEIAMFGLRKMMLTVGEQPNIFNKFSDSAKNFGLKLRNEF